MQLTQNNFVIRRNQFEENLQVIIKNESKLSIKFKDGKFKDALFGTTTKEKLVFKVVNFFSKSICKDFTDIEQVKPRIKKELIKPLKSEFLTLLLLGKKDVSKSSKLHFRQQINDQIFAEADKLNDKYRKDLLKLIQAPVHPFIIHMCKTLQIDLTTISESDFISKMYKNFESKLEEAFIDYSHRELFTPSDLYHFMVNRATRGVMENICKKGHCLEVFEFILALHKYKKLSIEKKEEAGQEIINKFLNEENGINIYLDVKNSCIDLFKKDKAKAFNEAERSVLHLLSANLSH